MMTGRDEARRSGVKAAGLIVLLGLLIGCSGKGPTPFVRSRVLTDAYVLAVTLDRCDCDACRVALQDPTTSLVMLNRSDLTVGTEYVATPCYGVDTADGMTQVQVTLECGRCPSGSVCTASATVTAGGDPVVMGGPSTCTSPGVGITGCQDQRLLTIDPGSPTVNCAP
jgi:hypothetical protein